MRVAYFISDHGYGHAARSSCILEALLREGHEVTAVTTVPSRFLHESMTVTMKERERFRLVSHEKVDVGLLQRDSVTVEYEETIANLERFFSEESMERKTKSIVDALLTPWTPNARQLLASGEEADESHKNIERRSSTLESDTVEMNGMPKELGIHCQESRQWIPGVIVTDISIFALLSRNEIIRRIAAEERLTNARERRKLEVVMVTNFTWPCIYSPLIATDERFRPFVDLHKRAYAMVDSLLVLPFYLAAISTCGVPSDRIHFIGGVSRISTVPSTKVRAWLRERERKRELTRGNGGDEMLSTSGGAEKREEERNVKYLLYSFGGFKAPIEECMQQWKAPPRDWRIVWVERSPPHTREEEQSQGGERKGEKALRDIERSSKGNECEEPIHGSDKKGRELGREKREEESVKACQSWRERDGGKRKESEKREERKGREQTEISGEETVRTREEVKRVMVINERELEEASVTYVDLLAAMDVALIKTGFGIVSECIRYRTSVLYVDRPGFEEHKALVKALEEQISCKEVELDKAKAADVFSDISDVWPNRITPQFLFTGVEEAMAVFTRHQSSSSSDAAAA